MRKPIKITLVIVAIFFLLLIVFLAIWTRPPANEESQKEKPAAANVNAGAEATPEVKIEVREPTAEELARTAAEILSKSFAERFGSYSNDGNFENVIDLYPLMTSSMKSWAENYVVKMRAEIQKQTYEGTTTKAMSVSFNSLNVDEGAAETVVKTQRTEIKTVNGAQSERVYYQDLRLELVKVGDEWKIDGAYWVK